MLIEADSLVALDLPMSALGTEVRLLASGVGDVTGPAEAALVLHGSSIAPPAPVGLRWEASADGGVVARWTRRSRAGWRWGDGGAAPLVEEREAYRVDLPGRTVVVATQEVAITAAERGAGPLTMTVRQLGTHAPSRPAIIIIPTN